MEFLNAAALSDGHCGPTNPMLDMYRSGDPYLSFAKRVGAAPAWATKKTHEELRDRYKVGLLAVQYGMQVGSPGHSARHLDVRSARNAQPAPRAVRPILAVVGRLGPARASDRQHANRPRLGMPHRNHRVQRALDSQFSGAGQRRGNPTYRLHHDAPTRYRAAGSGS